jgi:hypothetical protein
MPFAIDIEKVNQAYSTTDIHQASLYRRVDTTAQQSHLPTSSLLDASLD